MTSFVHLCASDTPLPYQERTFERLDGVSETTIDEDCYQQPKCGEPRRIYEKKQSCQGKRDRKSNGKCKSFSWVPLILFMFFVMLFILRRQ